MTAEPAVSLVEMTDDELATWLPGAVDRFVATRVSAGESSEQATVGGEAQRERSFPGGRPLPGHHVLHVVAGDNRVGAAWISPGPGAESSDRHVIVLELDEAHRGAGTHRAAVLAAERWAVDDGATRLALAVFGRDEGLEASYAELGYVVAATSMFKQLD
jgi:GNAT superfamily N-acetyltransferase